MDSQEITKIKQLITLAPILSSSERGEWLVLLDLMNDRQLQELEKILSDSLKPGQKSGAALSDVMKAAGRLTPVALQIKPTSLAQPVNTVQLAAKKVEMSKPSAVFNHTNPIANLNPVKPAPPAIPLPRPASPTPSVATPPASPAPAGLPKLSHIANLPNMANKQVNNLASKSLEVGVSPASLVKNLQEKNMVKPEPKAAPQVTPFSLRLKEIISEKELPAATPPVVEQKPITAPPVKPVPAPIAPPKIELPKIQPPVKPAPAPVVVPPITPPPPKIQPAPAPTVPILKPLPKLSPLPKGPISGNPAFTPGLNFQHGSSKSAQDTLQSIKEKMEHKEGNKPVQAAAPVQQINLETLQDLAAFDLKSLTKWNIDPLVSKIKQLIGKFGYFDVIFSIEKSPLYKTYIDTGLKMLTAQADFEQLAAKAESGEILTRQQFEKLTDVLTKIQAA